MLIHKFDIMYIVQKPNMPRAIKANIAKIHCKLSCIRRDCLLKE